MILILENNITAAEVAHLQEKLTWMGFRTAFQRDQEHTSLAVVHGIDKQVDPSQFIALPKVEKVLSLDKPYKLASRQYPEQRTLITVKGQTIGGGKLAVMAGPCSIESKEQIFAAAECAHRSGAGILRGGAFKPRTSPYAFQGMGEEGLKLLHAAAKRYDLLTVSEAMDEQQLELVAGFVDIVQIGARNMQNFSLLKKLGTLSHPILLKRGMSATYQDLLMSAEYILSAGNPNVILCERGIRTYETHSRNTLDLAAIPILHELSHLPVIADPSHGTGLRKMVAPMALAAVAAGADGLMIEMHPQPEKALSDAEQTLSFEEFSQLMKRIIHLESVLT